MFTKTPFLKLFEWYLRPSSIMADREEPFADSYKKVVRRMGRGNDREDFFGHLLSKKATNLTPQFLTAQANSMIVAGSETTPTFLTGMCGWLLPSADIYMLTA